MNKLIAAGALMAGMLTSAHASAAQYLLKAKGTISMISRSTSATVTTQTPLTSSYFSVGDTLSVTYAFDTNRAQLTSLFDADPTTNIYYLPGSTATVNVGAYSSTLTPRSDFSSSVQLWNDRIITNSPVDSQSFEISNFNNTPFYPFAFDKSAITNEIVSLGSYDFTAMARQSDLLSQLVGSSSQFSSNSLTYSFAAGPSNFNDTDPLIIGVVVTNNVSWTLTAVNAVPEPATWMLMFTGMMMTGYALRRRTVAYADRELAQ